MVKIAMGDGLYADDTTDIQAAVVRFIFIFSILASLDANIGVFSPRACSYLAGCTGDVPAADRIRPCGIGVFLRTVSWSLLSHISVIILPHCSRTASSSRTHLCGLDINLTYPQNGIIPTIVPPATTVAGQPNSSAAGGSMLLDVGRQRGVVSDVAGRRSRGVRRRMLKRVVEKVERDAGAMEKRGIERKAVSVYRG